MMVKVALIRTDWEIPHGLTTITTARSPRATGTSGQARNSAK